ncbi:MAG: porin family protein [Proteobacteria bacterium]|nr:porin family protein [Pseudomonadota bacterium]
MKLRTIILAAVVVALICSAAPAWASQGKEMPGKWLYLGAGVLYAFPSYDLETSDVKGVSTDNHAGITGEVGYHLSRYVAMELAFAWLPDWESEGTYRPGNFDGRIGVERETQSLIGTLRLSPPWQNDFLRPSWSAGLGYVWGDQRASDTKFNYTDESWITDDRQDFAVRTGLGLEIFPIANPSLMLEGVYQWGLGDLDGMNSFEVILSVQFHFMEK